MSQAAALEAEAQLQREHPDVDFAKMRLLQDERRRVIRGAVDPQQSYQVPVNVAPGGAAGAAQQQAAANAAVAQAQAARNAGVCTIFSPNPSSRLIFSFQSAYIKCD